MRTTLTPEQLAEAHAAGRAAVGRFVNPHTIAKCRALIRERGWEWAASVLMRRLDRASAIDPTFPWLLTGEDEILVAAEAAELAQLAKELAE